MVFESKFISTNYIVVALSYMLSLCYSYRSLLSLELWSSNSGTPCIVAGINVNTLITNFYYQSLLKTNYITAYIDINKIHVSVERRILCKREIIIWIFAMIKCDI